MIGWETEWKFDVGEDADLPELPGVAIDERRVRLEAIYWDTADLALLGWGATLRYRSASDGSECGWTLKLGQSGPNGAAIRAEVHVDGSTERPPAELLSLASALTMRTPLHQVAKVTTDRHARLIGSVASVPAIELADDRVESMIEAAPGPRFRQVEVEVLGSADEAVVASVLEALRNAGLQRSVERSKLEAVLCSSPARPFAVPGRLPKRATAGDFVSALFRVGIGQLVAHDPGVRMGLDLEAVHQARVATRRLRSDLRTFRALMDPDEVRTLRRELRWLGELLGGVRDGQVLARNLDRRAAGFSVDPEVLAELTRRATDQIDFRRSLLMSAMRGDRYFALLTRLSRNAAQPRLRRGVRVDRPVRVEVERLVRRRWKRVKRDVRDLGFDPSDAELHELRKEVKQLRYAVQSARLVGMDGKRFARELGRLQDVLGEHHDAVVEMEWLESESPGFTPSGAFLAGRLHGAAHERHLHLGGAWRTAWSDAAGDSPF